MGLNTEENFLKITTEVLDDKGNLYYVDKEQNIYTFENYKGSINLSETSLDEFYKKADLISEEDKIRALTVLLNGEKPPLGFNFKGKNLGQIKQHLEILEEGYEVIRKTYS